MPGLRGFLTLLGMVALVAGLVTVLTGASTILDANEASPSVDSELRFFAAWYVGVGVALLRAARDPAANRGIVHGVAALFGLAATGRVLSWATVGRPSTLAVVLLFVEYAIALGLPLWHRRATP
ncbi:MAG TPA: DUF4345 domain-containing protein [Egibacteraceae bacterium]|nr:DUF4345 domain-containing protein [Egibacteraceae bacterium]